MTPFLLSVHDELGGGWTRDYRAAPLTLADAITAAQLFAFGDRRAITQPGTWTRPLPRGGTRIITVDRFPRRSGCCSQRSMTRPWPFARAHPERYLAVDRLREFARRAHSEGDRAAARWARRELTRRRIRST